MEEEITKTFESLDNMIKETFDRSLNPIKNDLSLIKLDLSLINDDLNKIKTNLNSIDNILDRF